MYTPLGTDMICALPYKGPPGLRLIIKAQYAKTSDKGLYVVVIMVMTAALPSKNTAECRYCQILIAVTLASNACAFATTRCPCPEYEHLAVGDRTHDSFTMHRA